MTTAQKTQSIIDEIARSLAALRGKTIRRAWFCNTVAYGDIYRITIETQDGLRFHIEAKQEDEFLITVREEKVSAPLELKCPLCLAEVGMDLTGEPCPVCQTVSTKICPSCGATITVSHVGIQFRVIAEQYTMPGGSRVAEYFLPDQNWTRNDRKPIIPHSDELGIIGVE